MRTIVSTSLVNSVVFACTAILVACGGVTPFEGRSAAVVGEAAPPPPPPPVAAPAVVTVAKVKHVMVTAEKIVIDEKIQFEQAKAAIKPESNALLDEIAGVMNNTPAIKKIEIQGHASGEGDAKANTKLSDERAKSVMAALVSRKVKAEILTAKGYGSDKKIADEKTDADREKNRRVEFLILDPAPKPSIGSASGMTNPVVPATPKK
jgi:outer membrane protein OmpA-like peptidoglycan-associated protein